MKSNEAVPGTQLIQRAMLVLRVLATRPTFGWTLGDLAAYCELDKATAHRIVRQLVIENLADQRESDGKYVLGPLVFELGLSVPGYPQLLSALQGPIVTLSRKYRGIASVCLRSGNDLVYVACAGDVDIKGLAIRVGVRRPLISTSGGAAILAALPRAVARRISEQCFARPTTLVNARGPGIRRMLRRSFELGYGINDNDMAEGVSACGFVLHNEDGTPFAAVAIAGSTLDIDPTSAAVVLALNDTARQLEQVMHKLLYKSQNEPDGMLASAVTSRK